MQMIRFAARSPWPLAALAVAAACAAQAQTEFFQSMTSSACSSESRNAVAANARRNVESRVSRAEASIQPPIPVGDLSCLDSLMRIGDDFLSGEALSGRDIVLDLLTGLGAKTILGDDGSQASRQVCDFAVKKWEELTRPLKVGPGGIRGGVAPEFTRKFAMLNLPPPDPAPAPPAAPPPPQPSARSAPAASSGAPTLRAPAAAAHGGAKPVLSTAKEIYDEMMGGTQP